MRQIKCHRFHWLVCLLLPGVLLTACSDSGKPAPAGPGTVNVAVARLAVEPADVARGGQLFKQHCASCHGERAQAAAGWERPGVDGKYPPPPLDGSAHAWHHPAAALKDVIANGTQRIGGNMPPWRDKLSEADIEAVIMYFQSLWPAEIYQAWADLDRRDRMGAAQ